MGKSDLIITTEDEIPELDFDLEGPQQSDGSA